MHGLFQKTLATPQPQPPQPISVGDVFGLEEVVQVVKKESKDVEKVENGNGGNRMEEVADTKVEEALPQMRTACRMNIRELF